jgi:hypothetical protein
MRPLLVQGHQYTYDGDSGVLADVDHHPGGLEGKIRDLGMLDASPIVQVVKVSERSACLAFRPF